MGKLTAQAPAAWQLRPAVLADADEILALASHPSVYRFLFDGAAPARAVITEFISESLVAASRTGLGMWCLTDGHDRTIGCMQLRPSDGDTTAEVSYFLHQAYWGRGLATRLAASGAHRAFALASIADVTAAADSPNGKSIAVMQRIGMRYNRQVSYPLGPGVEYVMTRRDYERAQMDKSSWLLSFRKDVLS